MDKPCQAQPFSQEIMGDKHQTSKSIVGNKGYPNPSRDPTVSQAAHSAAMSPFESYIFSYSNLTTLTTYNDKEGADVGQGVVGSI